MDPNANPLIHDPLPPLVRENDHFLLVFADNRHVFAQAIPKWQSSKMKNNPCKVNKRTYTTHHLIGLPYGTVLEVTKERLVPLEEGADLVPTMEEVGDLLSLDMPSATTTTSAAVTSAEAAHVAATATAATREGPDEDTKTHNNEDAKTNDNNIYNPVFATDNRHFTDDNTSQSLTLAHITRLQRSQTPGREIVAALVSNSSTFRSKTAFSQAKYLSKKQQKHMPRCRIVRMTPSSLCRAMFLKDARKVANLREDTLGWMMSAANVHAGQRVLVMDGAVQGLVVASCARKMGGYGKVVGVFEGQQPSYLDVVARMNLSLGERYMIKWVGVGEIFGDVGEKRRQMESLMVKKTKMTKKKKMNDGGESEDDSNPDEDGDGEMVVMDVEKRDRENLSWPPPLQPHTRDYLQREMKTERQTMEFMNRRSARFARKLTRHSMLEMREMIDSFRNEDEIAMMEKGHENGCANSKTDVGDGTKVNGVEVSKMDVDKTEKETENNTDENNTSGKNTPTNPNEKQQNQQQQLLPQQQLQQQQQLSTQQPSPPLTQCDSLIIATKYNPTTTLLRLLPYLAPSCPFVIYHEYLEPLLETFRHLQNISATTTATSDISSRDLPDDVSVRKNLAINLRLTDCWFREYQVLEGRTHPNMTMSQNGGYLLMGTKLCPRTGTNELDEGRMKELRARIGGRRTNKGSNGKRKGGGEEGKKGNEKRAKS